MMDRRGFLGRVVGGATAIAIKSKMPGTIGAGRLPWGGGPVSASDESSEVAGLSTQNSPVSLARIVLERAFNKARDTEENKMNYRIGGFDPDIYALQSVSQSSKVKMQYMRDRATRHRIERMRLKLWSSGTDRYDGFY